MDSSDRKNALISEKVALILDELKMAVKWQRPSLIIVVYRSELTRRTLQDQLANALSRFGQISTPFIIDRDRADVPVILSRHPRRLRTVYQVSGLRWGGGRGGLNAYRALNLHREYFVDHQLRVIFWLSHAEAALLPRRAPDFWAFRHRVFEFLDLPYGIDLPPAGMNMFLGTWQDLPGSREAAREIVRQKDLLKKLPAGPESLGSQLDLNERIAALYWVRKEYRSAHAHLESALKIAQKYKDRFLQVHILNNMGFIHASRRQYTTALQVFEKASKLDVRNADVQGNLAIACMMSGDLARAVRLAEAATKLQPRRADVWHLRGLINQDLGLFDDAAASYRKATRLAPGDIRIKASLDALYDQWGGPTEASQ